MLQSLWIKLERTKVLVTPEEVSQVLSLLPGISPSKFIDGLSRILPLLFLPSHYGLLPPGSLHSPGTLMPQLPMKIQVI